MIDVFAWRIGVSASLVADFNLDALEHTIYERRAAGIAGLVHHSDRDTQGVSLDAVAN